MCRSEATIRNRHGTTDWFKIGKGLCQDYILPPCLFNVCAEYIIWNSGLIDSQAGIKIARRNIYSLRYADDTTLMAESEEGLKSLLMRMKEENKKAGSKINIQKTKIMASRPMISWQIDGEKVEMVAYFIFLGSKITADGNCSHEINNHVWMWELDHKENWAPKNWCFRIVVLEKTLDSSLDSRRSNQSILKRNQPWIFIGRSDAKAEAPILWPPDVKIWFIRKDSDTGRDWGQEEKGTTEDEMAGWHHRLNGHESEQTLGDSEGQGSLVCCSPWGHKESDTT